MRVNLGTMELTDDQRRALRRAAGRGGMATRAEVAALAQSAVRRALEGSPAPAPAPAPAATPPASRRPRPDDGLTCRHCGLRPSAAIHGAGHDRHHVFATAWKETA